MLRFILIFAVVLVADFARGASVNAEFTIMGVTLTGTLEYEGGFLGMGEGRVIFRDQQRRRVDVGNLSPDVLAYHWVQNNGHITLRGRGNRITKLRFSDVRPHNPVSFPLGLAGEGFSSTKVGPYLQSFDLALDDKTYTAAEEPYLLGEAGQRYAEYKGFDRAPLYELSAESPHHKVSLYSFGVFVDDRRAGVFPADVKKAWMGMGTTEVTVYALAQDQLSLPSLDFQFGQDTPDDVEAARAGLVKVATVDLKQVQYPYIPDTVAAVANAVLLYTETQRVSPSCWSQLKRSQRPHLRN